MADFWKPTSEMYSGLIDKPKMTEKLLSKPPFKYIFDIIMQTSKKTNFGRGLYQGQQTNGDYYKDRDTKITFLTKIIQLTEMMGGVTIEAKPQKIVAGLQPQNTNDLLKQIYKVATSGKNSDAFVKKILGGSAQEEQQKVQKKQPQKKKIQRPPSAARGKKPQQQPQVPSKKSVQLQQPVQKEPPQPVTKKSVEKPQAASKKQQYSKKVQQIMDQGEEEKVNEKNAQQQEQPQQSKNKLGNLRKKKKNDKGGQKIISSTGQLNQKELEMLQSMIQSICQNTAPLGKSIQFINDDVEAMNKQLQFWRRQYNASKTKMHAELKISQESLLPVYDKIAEIQDQIKDQKAKIQNAKAQIIKNDSTIKNLLLSVVTTK